MGDMYGKGMLKGLGVTFRHFMNTYLEDIRWLARGKRRYYTEEGLESRKSAAATGIFTVQYPEEKLPVPEEFRFIPFLIYEVDEDGEKKIAVHPAEFVLRFVPRSVFGSNAPTIRIQVDQFLSQPSFLSMLISV